MSAAPTSIKPEAAAAFNTANAAFREGRFEAARDAAAQAARLAPAMAIAHVLNARALRRLGDAPAARTAYEAALTIDPTSFDALLEHGNVLRGLGEPVEAIASYSKAMEVRPLDARPALALARLWEEQPDQDAAERAAVAFQHALDRAGAGADPAPAMAGLCRDMARFRMERNDLPRALDVLRQARLLVEEGALAAMVDLDISEVYLRLGMMEKAQLLMEKLSGSEDPSLLRPLAQLAYRFNFWAEAVAILTRWTVLQPDDAQAHLDLADMQVKAWLLEDALVSLDRAEASGAVPPVASAALRASIANRLGDADTALALYEGLVAEGQDSFAPNAAMSLLYADTVTPEEVATRHRALFASWGHEARSLESFGADPNPDRPLRIGMVSGDLHHQHPVNIFMQPLLARWDHAGLPLTIYNTGSTVDDQTRLARSRVGTWHDVSTAQLPARIAVDRIDILIDLAGHTAGGTMRAFARRMAPVQASFLGYPGSTGVPNIDWLIGDPVVTPPGADHLCSEQVMRLPNTVFCFAPEVDYPLPDFESLAKGRPLTFGSFNNIPKLTPRTVRLWANVLLAIPGARLLLRAPSFKDAGAVARFRRLFADHGIDADRLVFRGPVGLDVMMQSYSEIDIALDPVPYCGGTTSLQALWMGVPVLTMEGGQFVSRMGASFMTAAGLPDWVARNDGDYVAKAVAIAQDRTALLDLKRGLRARLLAQPGWDADRYAKDFAEALRQTWSKTMQMKDA
jgi:predicted O-linked N-acetylglucosamine transferase (SPINDLY family)